DQLYQYILETTVPQKEETFQVVIDIIKNSTCFKAFTISADVPEIFMQQFWYTIKKVQDTDSYEFLLANNKCIVNAEVFRTILDICPRVEGVDFTDVPDDDTALTFLINLGYKGPLNMHTNMFVDHISSKSVVFQDTPSTLKSKPTTSTTKLKGTEFSNKGTSIKPGVPEESTVISATSSEGTSTKPEVLDEETNITKEKYNKDGDADDKGDDHVSDTQDADEKDDETESDEDEIYKYKIRVRKDDDTYHLNHITNINTIPTPPITTDAPTIITAVHESDTLFAVELRVVKLEKDVSELKTVDHSSQALASDLKGALYHSMHSNKSFNRNHVNHQLYHALIEALIKDENAMDKGVTDIVKDHKRKHDDDEEDDDEDPPAGPNQEWFKQPPRPPTPDTEWNKSQVVLDQPAQPWFNQMVSALKDPFTFNDLMATPIDFFKYVLNGLKIEIITQDIFLGPTFNLLKEGDHYPFDLSKPLPLQGPPGY
nr:hypothetical protein [Tanacetum cinerariifolium]